MSAQYKIPESVLVVIYTQALQVLLMERADQSGFWQSVTGSKNVSFESLEQTAIREVEEETGIQIAHEKGTHLLSWNLSNIYDIYPMWRHRYAPGVTRNIEHVFGLCIAPDQNIVLNPREHVRYVWLPYREAADQCFSPSNAEAILQLPQRIEARHV